MAEPQPEYVWAFPPEKPKAGRMWVIVLLAVAAIAIAVGVFLMFMRPWEQPAPAPTDTATASATPEPEPSETVSPTPSATPSATPTQTPSPEPTPTETRTQPPVSNPELAVFRDRVQPRLEAAVTGLSYARDSSSTEGMQLVDQLRIDVGWMSDAVAPSAIADQWNSSVAAYGRSLDGLRAAFENGTAIAGPLSAAESALQALNGVLAN